MKINKCWKVGFILGSFMALLIKLLKPDLQIIFSINLILFAIFMYKGIKG